MKRYIAHMYTGMVGTDEYAPLLAENDEEAYAAAHDMATDHASMYGIEADMDEDDEMFDYGEIGASVEEYDPVKHDSYRSGGGSFESDFQRLEKWL